MRMTAIDKKFAVTAEGLSHLKDEHSELTKIIRPNVIERIQRAREFGDLTENSEYDAAKEEQSLIEARISELEGILGRVELISLPQSQDFVVIGSTVSVLVDGHKDEFKIVGTVEADPMNKKISSESPVGSALLGARIGETIEVATPIIRAKYKILQIK